MRFVLGDGLGQWILAAVVSLGLHVVVVSLLVGLHGCEGSKPSEPVKPETAVETAAVPPQEVKPEVSEMRNDVPPVAETRKQTRKTTQPNRPSKSSRPAPQKAETWDDIVDTKAPPAVEPAKHVRKETPAENMEAASNRESTDEVIFYEVKRGDNLTRIAREHGCTPEELARLNGKDLKTLNILILGSKIKVYNRK